jgi:hypothetical protein
MNGTAHMPLTDVNSFKSSTTITTNFSTQAQAGSNAATPTLSAASPSNSMPDTFADDAEKTDLTSTSQHSDNGLKSSETVSGVKGVQEVTRDDQVSIVLSLLGYRLIHSKSLRNNPFCTRHLARIR